MGKVVELFECTWFLKALVIQVCRNLNFICFLTCKLTFNDVTDLNVVTGQLSFFWQVQLMSC